MFWHLVLSNFLQDLLFANAKYICYENGICLGDPNFNFGRGVTYEWTDRATFTLFIDRLLDLWVVWSLQSGDG